MKLMLDTVARHHGRDAVASTLAAAGIPGERIYGLNRLYDDAEGQRLMAAALARVSVDDIADVFVTDTAARFPTWFAMCKTSREFLEMQPEVHNTFAHGLQHPEQRDAVRDKFRLERREQTLVVHYRSPNKLCDLYRAIARRVLVHYQETATIDEPHCMKRGDPACELHICWPP